MKPEQKQITDRELEHLSYEDVLVNLNSLMEQYGCRKVLKDFHDAFPQMFKEVQIQIGRFDEKKTAALLR